MLTQSNFRLLVVRLGAMGDILHALPAVTALRRVHPDWTIDWIVEPRWRALLAATDSAAGSTALSPSQPLVNRIYAAAVKDWSRNPLGSNARGKIRELRKVLRAAGYHAVIDFQGAIRSAWLGRMARSPRLIGEADPRERAARWLFTQRVATRGIHVIEQDIEVAAAVAGDALEFTEPLLPVSEAAEHWCDRLLPSAAGKPIALVNPGAGWGAKRWPVERYAEVASGLAKRGFHVLVNAGPGEEPLAEFVARETRGAAVPISCTLDQLIAVTRRIDLAIAGDTGPLHLASALARPVVGIFGPTDPTRNGPFGTRFRVLRSPHSLRDHTRRSAPESGMLTISPDDVLRAADELAAETRNQEAAPQFAAPSRGTSMSSALPPQPGPSNAPPAPPRTIDRWQRVARRIRVPLGFLTAALYLFELWRQPLHPRAIFWSLLLVLPGLSIRAWAAGTVKKNRELATSGPYAFTRNPLYLGSMLIAAGFALALLSWLVALVLALGFAVIYVPVIASEERFLRATFPGFDDYCRRVPRLVPRLTPRNSESPATGSGTSEFSFRLYLKHREYNALLGATLLYLCLFFLRPMADVLVRHSR